MSLQDKKQEIFGQIAAAKTVTQGLPKIPSISSLERTIKSFALSKLSVNNTNNPVTFLSNLIKILVGFEQLSSSVQNIISSSLPQIETEIKVALKTSLKEIVSCGINPSIPLFLKSTGSGIVIEVSKVDFLDQFKISPTSQGGSLLYSNITTPLTNSTDFNTFLYGVIQNPNTTYTWKGMLDITFNPIGNGSTIPNNTFLIKANQSYNNKTLTDLNNNFIDTLTLFNPTNILSKIVDILYGSISVSVGRTQNQLQMEAKINTIVDNLVNSDSGDQIDNSYFTFTNEQVSLQEKQANTRRVGIVTINSSTNIPSSIPVTHLTDLATAISATTNSSQQQVVITNSINTMAAQAAANTTNPSDNASIKVNFIQSILDNLIKSIVSILLTPKVIMIFVINYKILYGNNANYSDPIDFIVKNKNLINNIIKQVSKIIIEKLLAIVLKKITELVAQKYEAILIERAVNSYNQLLTLVGVNPTALRIMQGLSSPIPSSVPQLSSLTSLASSLSSSIPKIPTTTVTVPTSTVKTQ